MFNLACCEEAKADMTQIQKAITQGKLTVRMMHGAAAGGLAQLLGAGARD